MSKNERVRQISRKLMCPCPTCNWAKVLATCGCGAAEQEVERIEKEVAAGSSDQQIIDVRVARYGWKVLTVPPDTAGTRVAWLIPYVALGGGALGLGFLGVGLRRSRRRKAAREALRGGNADAAASTESRATPDGAPSAPSVRGTTADPYEKQLDDELRRLDK